MNSLASLKNLRVLNFSMAFCAFLQTDIVDIFASSSSSSKTILTAFHFSMTVSILHVRVILPIFL